MNVRLLVCLIAVLSWSPALAADEHHEEPPPGDYDCHRPASMDPAPRADWVVGPYGAPHQVHEALELVRAAANQDPNGDGITSICVEPGYYEGGIVVDQSEYDHPIYL